MAGSELEVDVEGEPVSAGDALWCTEGLFRDYRLEAVGTTEDGLVTALMGSVPVEFDPGELTRREPDSWARLRSDAALGAEEYCGRRSIDAGGAPLEAMEADIGRRAVELACHA